MALPSPLTSVENDARVLVKPKSCQARASTKRNRDELRKKVHALELK